MRVGKMNNTEPVIINDIIIASNTRYRIKISDGINEYTILKKHVIDVDEDSITLPEWLARKEGLI